MSGTDRLVKVLDFARDVAAADASVGASRSNGSERSTDMVGAVGHLVEPWARWRFGERVCVRCGDAPTSSLTFPYQGLVDIGLALDGNPWQVPVCDSHGNPRLWPIRLIVAMLREHEAVTRGRAPLTHEMTLWE